MQHLQQKATSPNYNQDTDSLEALRELLDAITAAGPTNTQMNTGHGLLATPAQVATALNTYDAVKRSEATSDKDTIVAAIPAMVGTDNAATEAKQDIMDTNVDQIEVLVAEKVMGRRQLPATTISLNQAAATYDLFTGTDQVVVLESLNIKMPTGAASGSITSISIQTDDATPGVIIPSTLGAVANLTSEANLSWAGTLYITVGTKIRLTIAGGAHGSAYTCQVTAQCQAVVSGGYLA